VKVHVHVDRITTAEPRTGGGRQLESLLGGAIARELGALQGADGPPADAVATAVRRGVQTQFGDARGPRPEDGR
jgi:hypothetical protein